MANPYEELLERGYGAAEAQERHRTEFQAKSTLAQGVVVPDEVLRGTLTDPLADTRYGVVIVARPPQPIRDLVRTIQESLPETLYCVPLDQLHITLLEIAHSRAEYEIGPILSGLKGCIDELLHPETRAVLHSPKLVYDSKAIALTFLSDPESSHLKLRAELYRRAQKESESFAQLRYANPNIHITVARFIDQIDDAPGLVQVLERVNRSLSDTSWQVESLQCIYGLTWYGKGTPLN